MIFIYEPHPYSLDIYQMRKYESYRLTDTDKQTDTTEII